MATLYYGVRFWKMFYSSRNHTTRIVFLHIRSTWHSSVSYQLCTQSFLLLCIRITWGEKLLPLPKLCRESHEQARSLRVRESKGRLKCARLRFTFVSAIVFSVIRSCAVLLLFTERAICRVSSHLNEWQRCQLSQYAFCFLPHLHVPQ